MKMHCTLRERDVYVSPYSAHYMQPETVKHLIALDPDWRTSESEVIAQWEHELLERMHVKWTEGKVMGSI